MVAELACARVQAQISGRAGFRRSEADDIGQRLAAARLVERR
jgi:hypothetical protein